MFHLLVYFFWQVNLQHHRWFLANFKMRSLLNTAATEPKNLARNSLCLKCFLLGTKIKAKILGVYVPNSFLIKIKEFAERNSIVDIRSCSSCAGVIHQCCPSCLKAYALKLAEKDNEKSLVDFILKVSDQEIGHEGYYLDRNHILKL